MRTKQRYVLLGLLVKMCLIVISVPLVRQHYFIPFLESLYHHPALNPWRVYLSSPSHQQAAFPYGVAMLLPIVIVSRLLSGVKWVVSIPYWINLSIGMTVLFYDYLIFALLERYVAASQQDYRIVNYYWFSPLIFFVTYLHGQLDIIPIFYLLSALYAMHRNHPFLSGVMLGLAVSAKLSMLIAVPVFFIYLVRNLRVNVACNHVMAAFLFTVAATSLPLLWNSAYYQMVIFNPQVFKLTDFSLSLSHNAHLFILPILYSLFLYVIYITERLTERLLVVLIAVAFSLILAFTAASISWYVWLVPFWVLYLVDNGSVNEKRIYLAVSYLFLVYGLLAFADLNWFGQPVTLLSDKVSVIQSRDLLAGWPTVSALVLLIISIHMLRKGILNNWYFQLSRIPISIGISGDSGTGKDTLALALSALFPDGAAVNVSGDDYHKWDRYSPMWKSFTHLDPQANNLNRYTADVLGLISGASIITRHYDHASGRFTKQFTTDKKDVVIASGLHVLSLPRLLKQLDVKIYLDMDEALRVYLKIQRDIHQRQSYYEKILHSISRRKDDTDRHIYPQKKHADIIFRLQPLTELCHQEAINNKAMTSPLCLMIKMRNLHHYDDMVRYLTAGCKCFVEMSADVDGETIIRVYGDLLAEDVELGVKQLAPKVLDLLSLTPCWHAGTLGLMQLITLVHVASIMNERSIERN